MGTEGIGRKTGSEMGMEKEVNGKWKRKRMNTKEKYKQGEERKSEE